MKNLDSGCRKSSHKSRVGIFCDLQNVSAIQNIGDSLLDFAKLQGTLDCKRVYYNSQRQHERQAKNKLETIGFKAIDVPDNSKNSLDKQLVFDCIKEVGIKTSLDVIIFVLGDWDFAGLISLLISLGKRVIIFAQRGSASPRLMRLVGETNFYYVDQLSDLVTKKIELPQNYTLSFIKDSEATEYLIESIKIASQQGKHTKLSLINTLMRQNFPKYQGVKSIRTSDGSKFSKFKTFVNLAVENGLVKMKNEELFLV